MKFSSDRVSCVRTVAGFGAILPVLGVVHSSLRTSKISSEASLSLGNSMFLLGCPIHIKTAMILISHLEAHQQRHYIKVTTNMPAILAVFKFIQQLI
jgi:hypothetical protein